MSDNVVSLNTKISREEKDLFVQTASELGTTPSAAIKIFVRKFNESGGFPFDVRKPKVQTLPDVPPDRIYRPERSDAGTAVLPAEWRDDAGDVYESIA